MGLSHGHHMVHINPVLDSVPTASPELLVQFFELLRETTEWWYRTRILARLPK